MGWIKKLLVQFIIVICLFFTVDYIYTNYLYTTDNMESSIPDNMETIYRIEHDVYHHTLLSSFDGFGDWGGQPYRVCTDGSGFKSDCTSVLTTKKNFDIAFMGDSFTEAIGMTHEESFVGMVAKENPGLDIVNLGVSSYSPTIYRTKIQNLIENGYLFEHIFVFVDISDIKDESVYFRDINGNVIRPSNSVSDHNEPFFLRLKIYVADNFFFFKTAYLIVKRMLVKSNDNIERDVYHLERSEWTYNLISTAYGDLGVRGSIDKSIQEMELLYEMLEKNNIKLSVGVYPWPAQLLEMSKSNSDNNLQSSIWREFCLNKCVNFIDMFPIFSHLIDNSTVESVYQNYFIDGDVHYNKDGNSLVYETILKLIEND